MNFKLAVLIIGVIQVNGENTTSVSNYCIQCTSDGESGFYKHVYYAAGQPRFSCMRYPPRSNLSWIVGRYCNKEECADLEVGQPAKRIYQPDEVECGIRIKIDKFPQLIIKPNSTLNFIIYNDSPRTFAMFVIIMLLLMIFAISYYATDVRIKQVQALVKKNKSYELCNEPPDYDTVC